MTVAGETGEGRGEGGKERQATVSRKPCSPSKQTPPPSNTQHKDRDVSNPGVWNPNFQEPIPIYLRPLSPYGS